MASKSYVGSEGLRYCYFPVSSCAVAARLKSWLAWNMTETDQSMHATVRLWSDNFDAGVDWKTPTIVAKRTPKTTLGQFPTVYAHAVEVASWYARHNDGAPSSPSNAHVNALSALNNMRCMYPPGKIFRDVRVVDWLTRIWRYDHLQNIH